MSADALIGNAQSALQNAAIAAPKPTVNAVAADKAAKSFAGVFISEFLGSMFQGISTDGPFGGGAGEAMFRSLLMDQYGKAIADQGGFGLASAVKASLLKTQEARP